MPSLPTIQGLPQIVTDSIDIPTTIPVIPGDSLVFKRYPEIAQWNDDLGVWWKQISNVLSTTTSDAAQSVNANTQTALNQTIAINGLSATVNIITSTYATQTYVQATAATTLTAANAFTTGSVSAEATIRATNDGNLSGKYTLTVTAGNVVTGMNITSATGPGTNISSVTFETDRFLIYSGSTGVQMFDASSGSVRIGATLVVDVTNQKMYIGTGTYNNSTTYFYVDSTGKFSLKDKLLWDGSQLTVSGSILLTSAAAPSGSGLFIGSDHLGYYASGAWKTYMDSSGNFYLGGTSGALQWNGSTLSISGSITANSGTIGGLTIGSNKIYTGGGTWGSSGTGFYVDSSSNFSLGNKLTWNNSVLVVSGSILLTQSAGPSGSGLFIGSDFLGYYSSGAWKTYMDSSGHFYLGGTGGALQWDGTTLSISGVVNITGGNAAKTDFSNVTAAYAGSPSTGGAANSITGQGALATQNSASWTTQVSARPVELTDGRIAVAISSAGGVLLAVNAAPSGSGLFLGSDFLGYYTSGSWRTYMDSSGNFYLGGVSGTLTWNGTTLTIQGNAVFSGTVLIGSGTTQVNISSGLVGVGNSGGQNAYILVSGGLNGFYCANGAGPISGLNINGLFCPAITTTGDIGADGNITANGYITVNSHFAVGGNISNVFGGAVNFGADLNMGGNSITSCNQLTTSGDMFVGGVLKDAGGNPKGPGLFASNVIRIYFSGSNVYADIDNGAATVLLG